MGKATPKPGQPVTVGITYPDDYLSPLFGEPSEDGDEPILAKDIAFLRYSFMEPDERFLAMAPNGTRNGRIKIPNEYFDIAKPKNGVTKFEFNPFTTTENDLEAHFGRGFYFLQPCDHRNKHLTGRNFAIGGPKRFQGEVIEEDATDQDDPNDPNDQDDEEDPVVDAIKGLAESQKEANEMFREHLKPAAAPAETSTSRLKEFAEIKSIFSPPVEVSLATTTNANRIDELMREHRKDLEKRDIAMAEARHDYRTELDSIRKKFDSDVDDIRKKADKAIETAKDDYKEDLSDRKKLWEESRQTLLKQIERLESDLHDRETSVDDLMLKRAELESQLLSARVLKEEAERSAKAANKDADDLEAKLEKVQGLLGKGGAASAADSAIPGLPGWVNSLIPLLPIVAPVIMPIIVGAMKASGTPIPTDAPPWFQEQLRAAMAQQPQQGFQQGPPPGWVPVQPQQGFQQGPPPGWVPVQPQQGFQQGPPPGWVPVQPQQGFQQGPPPGWTTAPFAQQPMEQQGFQQPPFQSQPFPQQQPQGFQQPFPGPPLTPQEEAWIRQQQGFPPIGQQQQPVVVEQQPIIAVRTASPIVEDDDNGEEEERVTS